MKDMNGKFTEDRNFEKEPTRNFRNEDLNKSDIKIQLKAITTDHINQKK
jgi:hypothetical protein